MSPRKLKWLVLLALLAGVAATLVFFRRDSTPTATSQPLSPEELITRGLILLEEQEQTAAREHWAPEYAAQEYGKVIDSFWDRLNAATNKFAISAQLPSTILLPAFSSSEDLPHNITLLNPHPGGPSLSAQEWRQFLSTQAALGWQINQAEFRHNQFTPGQSGTSSLYYFSAHLTNPSLELRAILEGNLRLSWDGPELSKLREVDASALELRLRRGPPSFQPVLNETLHPNEGYFIDPLIIRDLDRDGHLEIILAAKNLVFRRTAAGQWESSPLLQDPPRTLFTALLHDFNGDGRDDFLCATFDGLRLYFGTEPGQFGGPHVAWQANPRLKYAQTLTGGDIDLDGDLDLFLGQYKVPYDLGQMPVPYFDANDGHPSFLLLNDGKGNFTDVTGPSGLAVKRFRRVYSASFADMDNDHDLDLVVVSDFAGVDGWRNNGSGKFTSVTTDWFPERYGLGMAHQLADLDGDARLDFLMVGMNSPVADRLDHLRLTRPYHVRDDRMRAQVTFGNRLWATAGSTNFTLPIARTGWSWGAAAADLDNDTFPDLYIANGHETRQSVTEYEPHFWLHDIYVGTSQENSLAQAYFQRKFQRTRGQGQSYGGYEQNRLFLNRGGTNWIEVAHLFGLALQADSRSALAEDLNGDGKLDLIITTFEAWPEQKQTLQIFENRLEQTGHWISFDAQSAPPGTKILLENPRQISQTINGDGYRSQSSGRVHFGRGTQSASPSATLVLPGGKPLPIPQPAPGQLNPLPSLSPAPE